MCDPILLTGLTAAASSTGVATAGLFGAGGVFSIGTAAMTVGSAVGAFGSIMGAQQTAANSEYMANVANYNAQVQENNALAAQYSAEYDRQMFEDRFKRLLARQDTAYAKSGVVINQDTPLDVAADTVKEGKLEELAILYRGQTAATAARQGATGQRYAAVNYRSNAATQRTAGYVTAGAGLFKGIGRSLLA